MMSVLLVYAVYYDHRYQTGLRGTPRLPNFLRMWKLVQLGFPAATQFGMEVGVFAVCTALIAKLGAVPLASHQVALNTVSLTYMVPLGIASAAAVRVGQALGRGDPHGASRAGWTALALGMSFMFCMGVILFLVAGPDRASIHTRPCGDPCGWRAVVRRCVLPAIRRDANRGDRRPTRGR